MERQRAYHFRKNGKIALRFSLGTAYGIVLTVGVIGYVLNLIINQVIGMVPLANLSFTDPETGRCSPREWTACATSRSSAGRSTCC